VLRQVPGFSLYRRSDSRFFWSDIVDPVQNVTLSQTSSLITREKENLGRIRSRGVEIDGVVHVNRDIQISAGYEFTAATVVSYPSPPLVSLVGLEVAQVPRNVFTGKLATGILRGFCSACRDVSWASNSMTTKTRFLWIASTPWTCKWVARSHGTSNYLPLPKICSISVTRWRVHPSSI